MDYSLTREEEIELVNRMKNGDENSRDRLVEANKGLVFLMAQRYSSPCDSLSIQRKDLIEEGFIGLFIAAERYNPEHESKASFSTYAGYWVKKEMKRYLSMNSRNIRFPQHIIEQLQKLRETIFNAEEKEISSDIEELSERLKMSSRKVRKLLFQMNISTVPLDSMRNEDDESAYRGSDVFEDQETRAPYEELDLESKKDLIGKLLLQLDGRERGILERRFGLNGYDELKLEEAGAAYGITKERARQIEKGALAKLRDYFRDRGITPDDFLYK